VLGARKAGWKAIELRRAGEEARERTPGVISSLRELVA
jgi:FMN phosphatase YigB (HAD superfamily)